jgi:hypothetical protein
MPRSRAIERFAGLALVFFLARAAESQTPLEYQVKAAFLLNFTKFIEWPPSESTVLDPSFGICIVGEDPFGPVLDRIVEGETFQGRKLAVARVRVPLPASCPVVYVSKSEKNVAGLLSRLGPGVLTVGEGPGFLGAGGMVAFVVDSHKVRFDVNQDAAARAGLRVSSKLLSVARSVSK